MSNFGLYAKYYNLLYRDKDYKSEAEYVDNLIRKNKQTPSLQMLNLGCGTGKHDFHFIQKGYGVTGVDLSAAMIAEANATLKQQYPGAAASFVEGDVRTFRTDRKYDVVVSLFHVASYQVSNQDVLQMLETAEHHLEAGGLFIFDCWYGPAVLTHRPEVRVKRLQDDDIAVIRIAEPEMHPNRNVVDVNYEVAITDKKTAERQVITEKHPMRYFFLPEIASFIEQTKLQLLSAEEWLSGAEPDFDSWNVVLICKK